MGVGLGTDAVEKIEKVAGRLRALLGHAETEMAAVADGFEELARHTNAVLTPAAAIVACVEEQGLSTILPQVEALGEAARGYIQERLRATTGVLATVTTESKLLERLSEMTRSQRSVARETQTLSVLTNIEVARLGQLGSGFQYLAHELDDFSQKVTTSIKELAAHTEERRKAVDDTRKMLGAGLPRIQKEFARFEEDLTGALGMVRSSHEQLLHIPAQFQLCVQQIAEQIAGVVAAVQVHDITRQQLEHVEESLELIAARMHRAEETAEPEQALAKEWAQVAAGLAIQSYQLRSTQQAVSGWLRQIGVCMDGIVRISSSEVMGIGPLVLKQEEDLSAQLGRIEQIEQACQADNAEVQSTFAGLENLMQLVAEHVEKSRIVRDRLQLLTFNSIVEASHLGSKADAILEISQSIKRISVTWSGMTDHSAESMNQILQLVETAREDMQAFSAGGSVALQAAQEETRLGLESLRNSAGTASGKAAEVESAISNLQARVEAVGKTRDSLEASFSVVGQTLEHVDAVLLQVERDYPGSGLHWDARAAEADFGSYYTTELEREVLQAALRGDPLPEAQHNLSGNDVELF